MRIKLIHTAVKTLAPGASAGSVILVAIMFPEAGSVLSCSFDLWDAHCLADLHWSEPGGQIWQGVYQRASLWVVSALALDVSELTKVQVGRDSGPSANSHLQALKQRMEKLNAGGHKSTVCDNTYSAQNNFPASSCQSLTERNCANSIQFTVFWAWYSALGEQLNISVYYIIVGLKQLSSRSIDGQDWLTQIWSYTTWTFFYWFPQDFSARPTCIA